MIPAKSICIDRVVVINDFSISRGGASALAMLNAKLVRNLGVPVTYFAGDSGDIEDSLSSASIESVYLGDVGLLSGSSLSAATRGIFNLKAYFAMRKWIRENDTPRTIYHLHGWQQILSPSIFAALKSVANRTLMHAHDYFLVCPNGGQMNYVTNSVCNLTAMSASCVKTNCDKRSYLQKVWRVGRQGIRNKLNDLQGNDIKIAIIQHGMAGAFTRTGVPNSNLINLPNPCQPFSNVRVKSEFNDEFQFVGRLVEEKGIGQLLAAARIAQVKVRVLGDGPLLGTLTEQYPEVVFEGWCDRDRLAQLTQAARMLVMPSLYPEPFGLVVPEAISSGIPVMLSRSALLAEDVARNRLGTIIDPLNLEAFAELLRNHAKDNDSIQSMSLRGFNEPNDLSMRPHQWVSRLMSIYCELDGMSHQIEQ